MPRLQLEILSKVPASAHLAKEINEPLGPNGDRCRKDEHDFTMAANSVQGKGSIVAGLGTHLWLARRATRELVWPAPGREGLNSSSCINAFFNGCIAPDGGYFPGGVPLIADVAHYLNTGAFCETLFKESLDEAMRFYCWGWVLHVLTDVEIHPLVNAAVGEVIHRKEGRAISFAQDPLGHVRVENWLDSTVWGEYLQDLPDCQQFMTARDAETIALSFKKACFVRFSSAEIVRSQRAVVRFLPFLRRLGLFHAASHRQDLRSYENWFTQICVGCLSPVLGFFAKNSPVRGFLDVQPLPSKFLLEMNSSFDRVLTRFQSLLLGPMSLPDYNLDTGLVESNSAQYPLTFKTIQELRRTNRLLDDRC